MPYLSATRRKQRIGGLGAFSGGWEGLDSGRHGLTGLSQRCLVGLHRLAKGNGGLLGAVLIEEVAANQNKNRGDDSDAEADK